MQYQTFSKGQVGIKNAVLLLVRHFDEKSLGTRFGQLLNYI